MAKYRPVDVRLWNDRKFLALSNDGRLLWVFLLTAPSTLSIPGVIIGGEATIAEQIGWPLKRVRDSFRELFAKQLSVCVEGRLIWLPNALKYQPPRNPNMVKGWSQTWDDIPECALKRDLWQALRIACKSWSRLFEQLFHEPLAKQLHQDQDQDQEQEQEQEQGEKGPPPPGVGKGKKTRPGDPTETELASALHVLEKLSAQNGVKYSGTDTHVRLIVRQFRNGVSEWDMRKIIGYCAIEKGWKGDGKMHEFLCPETLFGPEKISKYLDPARAWYAKQNPQAATQEVSP